MAQSSGDVEEIQGEVVPLIDPKGLSWGDLPEGALPVFAKQVGLIYVIESAGFYKIGKTAGSPEERRKQLAPGCPFPLRLIHQFQCDDIGWAEDYLHEIWRSINVRGEWFALADKDLHWLLSVRRSESMEFFDTEGHATHPYR